MSRNAESAKKSLPQAKSWADVDDDDFFAAVAQDTPAQPSYTNNSASWGRSEKKVEKRSATEGGVSWTMPNLATPQNRFDGLSPTVRTNRTSTLGTWRK